MSITSNAPSSKQNEMEEKIINASSWAEIEKVLRDNKIKLSCEDLINLSHITEAGIESSDDLIDKIPYVFVVKENLIRVRQSFGNWVTLSNAVLAKIKSFE